MAADLKDLYEDAKRGMNITEIYGQNVFNDAVMRERLPREVYKSLRKTIDSGSWLDSRIADDVAEAMKSWAVEKGATHFTHWFQPLTGITAEKHEAFISPKPDGSVILEFSGKELIKGEPDASSFPSGGLRNVFEARGYTAWDCTSPAFIKDSTLYIPTVFFSYNGEALDNKIPLLKSMEAVNKQALRILRLFGDNETQKVFSTVGAEQEYFIIDREQYEKRLDLMLCGRTLFGRRSAKGQEMDDHYFGKLRLRIAAFMHELDEELWRLGVPSKTRHNEAAPAQHELVPVFTIANISCDHNQLIMETMKKIAKKRGLACLLHEKPFAGVNGSGKHNNWSLSTDKGVNLLSPGKTPNENCIFLACIAAVIKAVDEHADLLRFSAANPGNDMRLGMSEAPPAIISVFLGQDLTGMITAFAEKKKVSSCCGTQLTTSVHSLPTLPKDTSDRNRTSPFAFTGNKFEFRMCGSSVSIAMPCVVINTIVSDTLSMIADRLEKLPENARIEGLRDIMAETLRDNGRIVYNGNNYSPEWLEIAASRGLPNVNCSIDSYGCLMSMKNTELFARHDVLSEAELLSRMETSYELYAKTINIEVLTMLNMASRQILPAAMEYIGKLASDAEKLKALGLDCSVHMEDMEKLLSLVKRAREITALLGVKLPCVAVLPDEGDKAYYYHEYVMPRMHELREACDSMESIIPESMWPIPTYIDLMFRV